MRPQWEIDAIDDALDAREWRRLAERLRLYALSMRGPKVKKGRGQRRNRRNRP